MPAIVALVKSVPDTWSYKTLSENFTLDRGAVDSVLDEINEFSVEQALRLRDAHPDRGFRVIALTMGPADAEEALRRAIAMGADDAVHVVDPSLAGSDVLATAWVLHRALETIPDVAIVVAGSASSDGAAGAVPGILAEYRRVPALTAVRDVSLDGSVVRATREDRSGLYRLEAALPAVVSVTDKAAKPRFPNFKGLLAAKKHAITSLDLAAIGVDPTQVGGTHAASAVTAAIPRPAREGGPKIQVGNDGVGGAQAITKLLSERGLL